MSGQNLAQEAASLLAVQSDTEHQTGAVAAAKQSMLSFVNDFAARSSGSFAEQVAAVNTATVAQHFANIEQKLLAFANDNALLAKRINETNVAAKNSVSAAAGV